MYSSNNSTKWGKLIVIKANTPDLLSTLFKSQVEGVEHQGEWENGFDSDWNIYYAPKDIFWNVTFCGFLRKRQNA